MNGVSLDKVERANPKAEEMIQKASIYAATVKDAEEKHLCVLQALKAQSLWNRTQSSVSFQILNKYAIAECPFDLRALYVQFLLEVEAENEEGATRTLQSFKEAPHIENDLDQNLLASAAAKNGEAEPASSEIAEEAKWLHGFSWNYCLELRESGNLESAAKIASLSFSFLSYGACELKREFFGIKCASLFFPYQLKKAPHS
ncbi:hypothetical protein HDU96_003126 [Phlyctochytrium bullatum]|nr:hypothetical protein HDU96_003126 [Phlyctochytrium bullatum]